MSKAIFADGPTAIVKVKGEGFYGLNPSADLSGEWRIEGIEQEMIDVTAFQSTKVEHLRGSIRMTLISNDLRPVSPEEVEQERVNVALRDQPPEVKEAVEALFQIEQALGPDREAIVEVETQENGRPKFIVTSRINPNPPPPADVSEWYKRWRRP